jgi:hypothetical protein
MALVMFAVAGLLVGGAYSLVRQGASKVLIGVVGLAAVLALAAGLAWMSPGDS